MTMLRLEMLLLTVLLMTLNVQAFTTSFPSATTTAPPTTGECPSSGSNGIEEFSTTNESTNGTNCDATDFTFSVHDKTVAENDRRVPVIRITRTKAGVKAGVTLTVTVRTANAKRAINPFKMNIVFKECATEVTDFETITEKYKAVISKPSEGTIADGVATITVLDDDIQQP